MDKHVDKQDDLYKDKDILLDITEYISVKLPDNYDNVVNKYRKISDDTKPKFKDTRRPIRKIERNKKSKNKWALPSKRIG